jgi:hypothetical protein
MPFPLQVLLIVLLLAGAVSVACLRARRWPALAAISGATLAAAWTAAPRLGRTTPPREVEVATRPIAVPSEPYATSASCRACHPHEYDTWHDSYHRSMTQHASAAAVLADWDGTTLTTAGKQWRLLRREAEFWIDMEDPVVAPGQTGARVQRRVAMTTGSHNMQVYWYETGHGRVLGMLPFSWQIAERRWITRVDSFVQPGTDGVEHALGSWSRVCLKCHATHGRPRLDMDHTGLRGADTHVAEFGIACEACHGPGEPHVAAHRNPLHRYGQRLGEQADASIVDPRRLPFDRATQVCGSCHGLFDYQFTTASMNDWFVHGFAYRPGGDVLADRKLKFEGDEQFWSDGLVRVAGREYNALSGSACYERGKMSCQSCHVMHQPQDDPRPRAQWANDQLRADDGDRSCLQCHETYGNDVAAHTHHKSDSSGSACQNCHMPHTTYGLMKGVRTHRIASPSVASTLATGRPNACNQCHLDRTLAWTAEHLKTWYGIDSPAVTGDDATIATGVLWALRGNAAQRALVAWSFGWQPAQATAGRDWQAPLLAELLDDPYGVVRIIAERSMRTLPEHADVRYDPAGDAAARAALKRAVLAKWAQGAPARVATQRPALLLAADGSLRTDEVARLLRQRDLRIMRLFE